jgi:hypothetical protein
VPRWMGHKHSADQTANAGLAECWVGGGHRGVDQVLDMYVFPGGDTSAVRLFFDGVLANTIVAPVEVVTDQAGS